MTGDEAGSPKDAEELAAADPGVGEDDTRRKFREALEQKHRAQHATSQAAERDGSEKSHGAKGPTKARTFRRKSI